ncbi:MAG: outer membrane protein assembly factor BamD, partial [Candidatus Omnitrophica bacterium]|nr:outer membrane protein assembly factor BamD [Candidatus Omnitrophota bacterium]
MTHTPKWIASLLALSLLVSPEISLAYWVWSPEQGRFINPQDSVEGAAEQQFNFSMQFYKDKNYKRAENEFKNLVKQFPKSDVSAEALYYMGQIDEEQTEYFRAFKSYQKIIEKYPQSERIEEVIERQFRIGDMFMTGKKEKLLGLPIKPSIYHATEIFTKIVETSPYSAYGDQAQFRLAQVYRMRRDWKKSGEEYQKLIDNYPDSNLVDDAKFQMAECIALQASRPDRDQRALEVAAQNFDQFLREYPDSPIAGKAARLKEAITLKAAEKNFKIGEYYERDNYLESALIYYEDVERSYP